MTTFTESPDLFAEAKPKVEAPPPKPPMGLMAVGVISMLYSAPVILAYAGALGLYGYFFYKCYTLLPSTDVRSFAVMSFFAGNVIGFGILLVTGTWLFRAAVRACAADARTVGGHRKAALGQFLGWAVVLGAHWYGMQVLLSLPGDKARGELLAKMDQVGSPLLGVAVVAAAFMLYPLFVLFVPTLWYSRVQKNPFEVPRWQRR